MNEILTLGSACKVVQPHDYEQFVIKLISWYDRQVDPSNRNMALETPNVFELFDEPDYYGSLIIHQMIENETRNVMELENIVLATARQKVMYRYDENSNFVNDCLHDIQMTLNTYRLSYQYSESMSYRKFYNMPILEVW